MLLGQRVTWRNVYRWTHYFYKLEQQSKWEKQALLLSGNTGDTNVTVKVGFEHDAGKKCNCLKTGNFNVWKFKHPIKENINTLETGKIYSPPMIVERRWTNRGVHSVHLRRACYYQSQDCALGKLSCIYINNIICDFICFTQTYWFWYQCYIMFQNISEYSLLCFLKVCIKYIIPSIFGIIHQGSHWDLGFYFKYFKLQVSIF